jgi:hypothetical protein
LDKLRTIAKLPELPVTAATNQTKMRTEIENQIEELEKKIKVTHWTPKRLRLRHKLLNLKLKLEAQATA